jgi:hypothetical protein
MKNLAALDKKMMAHAMRSGVTNKAKADYFKAHPELSYIAEKKKFKPNLKSFL